jgi:2'-5' RNA ligase
MAATEPASAILIRVPVPAGLDRLRRRWDVMAGTGVPAHVTILFPFVAASALTAPHRATLAAIARDVAPFEIAFRQVGRFPTVVYLVPEPSAPIDALMAAIVERYPEHPPYGGEFAEVIPHLTVTEVGPETAPLDQIAAEAERWLPFEHHVTALEVLVESPEGRWRRHWRIPLGVRP